MKAIIGRLENRQGRHAMPVHFCGLQEHVRRWRWPCVCASKS